MVAGAGGAGQAGFAALDQWQRFGQSQVTASKAWDRYKDSVTRGPTWAAKGFEDAGINRILAAGSSGLAGTAKSIQAHPTGPGPLPDMTVGARRAWMQQQEWTSDAQMKLYDSQNLALDGQIAESQATAKFINSPEGRWWIRQKIITGATPGSLEAVAARGLMNAAGGFITNQRGGR